MPNDNFTLGQFQRIAMTLSEILANRPQNRALARASDVPGADLQWMYTTAYPTGAWYGNLGELGTTAFRDGLFTGYLATGVTCKVSGVPYSWSGSAWGAVETRKSIVATKKALIRKIAGALAGLNSLDIVFCGDSTTAGETVAGTQENAFPAIIQRILGARNYGKIRQGWIVCGGTSRNPDWNLGTWDLLTQIGAGGINRSGMIVSGFGAESWDIADVVLAKISGGGTVTATATGGTPIVTNVSGNSVVIIQPQAASASASNSVEFSCVSSGFVMAMRPRLSTENAIRIGNIGTGGSRTADWANATPTGGLKLLGIINPDILYVSLGANDAGKSITPSAYIQNIGAIVDNAASSTQIILASPIRSQKATLAALEAQYAAALKAFAESRQIPYHDLGAVIGDFDSAVFAPDGFHPNALGHAQLAQSLQDDLFGGVL